MLPRRLSIVKKARRPEGGSTSEKWRAEQCPMWFPTGPGRRSKSVSSPPTGCKRRPIFWRRWPACRWSPGGRPGWSLWFLPMERTEGDRRLLELFRRRCLDRGADRMPTGLRPGGFPVRKESPGTFRRNPCQRRAGEGESMSDPTSPTGPTELSSPSTGGSPAIIFEGRFPPQREGLIEGFSRMGESPFFSSDSCPSTFPDLPYFHESPMSFPHVLGPEGNR